MVNWVANQGIIYRVSLYGVYSENDDANNPRLNYSEKSNDVMKYYFVYALCLFLVMELL